MQNVGQIDNISLTAHLACPICHSRVPIISADKEGWEVSRVIPTCALTGQTAGAAAAVACRGNGDIRNIDYSELKKILLRNNVLFVE